MTLLIASLQGDHVWMVADTAITGGDIPLRDRRFQIKNVPSGDGRAIIGFAGDQHHGTRLLEEAANCSAGMQVVELLLEAHRNYPSVEFAYAFIDAFGPHLIKIANAQAQEVPTLHLGVTDAFDEFQRIRHNTDIDPIPEAVQTFIAASAAQEPIPEGLSAAIVTMLRLFAARAERDVGGWPVSYYLNKEGVFLCSYAYSASDPTLSKTSSGALVHHGTAEGGGFGLSLTPLGPDGGMVVYWLQRPGGFAFVRKQKGYEAIYCEGPPSVFKERMSAQLGTPVDIWFGDHKTGPVEHVIVMRDEKGQPAMTLAKHGKDFSFSVINTATPFRSHASLNLLEMERELGGAFVTDDLSLTLGETKELVTIQLRSGGQPATSSTMNAPELDRVMAWLGQARASMPTGISAEPTHEPMTSEMMVIDPAWRTERAIHEALQGITLRLRHPGFGWLTFLLPFHEATSLGRWLYDNASSEPKNE